MTDRTWKRLQGMLIVMAREDPNGFLEHLYRSGMEMEDIEDLEYLVKIARRAYGYDAEKDLLRINRVC
ncbi:MAG: hypothetical protein A2514_11330 [Gammaproteobacteria bacterium RIFOXYD12_FULL_61_37]|nr:MAG: hypothetical protein A2514_11330 [Gammaproteobacteria bacterium RIFOXYD12_FULL_61_37]